MAIIFSGNGVINTNGVVPIAQGGTGQITPDAAINALLPSQSGKNGQILSTDGATVKWIVNTGGTGGSGTGLPEQTGASGNFLTTDGTTAYWSPVIAAGIQAGGVDGQLQFNSNNVLTATPKMSYNNLDVLFVGGGTSDTFKIEGVDAFDNTYTGTTVLIKGGDSFANPLPTATPPAGDVIIMGGGGFGQGAAGNIIFKVGQIQAETFRITNTGAWALGGDKSLVGSAGNILVSQGSDGPPVWIPTPIATSTALGGVKVAANSGLTVDSTGFISANIKSADGSTIKNVDGQISVDLYKVLPEIAVNTSGKFLKATSTAQTNFTVEWAPVELNDVLPEQTGFDGLVLTTNGNTANWASPYPSQTDKAGQFLVTDGTSVSWSSNPSTIATTEGIGAVKPDGSTITVTEEGVISANVNSILPDQTGNENKLLTTDGTSLSWVAAPEEYVLPVATSTTLGGITSGVGLTVSPSGALNLTPATGTMLGGIKPGPGTVLESDGTFGVYIQNASAEGLGLVRVGSGLSINSDGILSVVGGGGGSGGGGSGTVTEVEISSTDLSVTTSPITSSGKIAIGLGLNTVPVNKGGTGLQQINSGALLVGGPNNTYESIASVQTDNVLLSNGTDARPVYGKINLSKHIAGVLPIEYGGTGASTAQGATQNIIGYTPVNKSGDTMTGLLTLSGAPTDDLHAATKQYVDDITEGQIKRVQIIGDVRIIASTLFPDGLLSMQLDLNTVSPSKGGTGIQQISQGALLVGGANNTYETISSVQTDNVLLSNGIDAKPIYGKVNLNNHVAGVLPIQYGGTGASTAQGATQNIIGYSPVNKAGDTMTGTLTLSGPPTSGLQAATKQYVDSVATGLTIKHAVRVATTENISAVYANGFGIQQPSTLTGSGPLPLIDGVSLTEFSRILVKNQTNKIENGVYVVTNLNPFSLQRAGDAISIVGGDAYYVTEGTQAATTWVTGPKSTITLGTTEIEYAQFGGPGQLSEGIGINIESGVIKNTGVINITGDSILSVSSKDQSGNVSITLDGIISASKGGTGNSQYAIGDLLYASDSTSLSKIPIGSSEQVLTVVNNIPRWRSPKVNEIIINSINGFTGSSSSFEGVARISVSTTVNGILKGNSNTGEVSSAVAGVDYQAPMTASTGIQITSNSIKNTGVINIQGSDNISVSTKDTNGNVNISFDGVLSTARGGTGNFEYAAGDLLYASDATTLSKIPIGSAGQILTVVGTVPSWNNPIVSEIKVNEQKGFKGVVNNSNGLVDITISTTTSGLLKGNSSTGEVISAVAGVDYQAPISITTTGTSGPATLVDGVLNIPQYSGGGEGGGGGGTYTLPTASDIVLGGVKIDNTTITIANGVISSQINALLPTQDSQSGKFLTTNGAGTLSWDSLGVSAATPTELGGIKIDSAVSEIDEAGFYKTTKLSLNSQQNKQILFNDNGVSSTAAKLLYNNTELNVGAASDSKFDITSATDLNLIAADEKNVSIKTKELKIYTYNDSQYAMLEPCRTVTTANITVIGGTAATLQIAAGSDLALFDNVDINVGDRILFKNQDNQSLNRVYVMTLKDHPVVWQFAITSDFENAITNSKIPVVEITEGSLSGSKLQGTINETNITWEEFDPSTVYTKNFEILRTGAVSFGPTTNTGVQGQTLISNESSQAPTWGTLGVSGGGTGKTSFSPGFLKSDGAEISSAALSVDDIPALPIDKISETVPVNKGGTGATSLTGYIVGSGTDSLTAVSKIPLSDIDGTITVDPENINSPVTIDKGGTGANNAAAALLNLNAVSKSGDTITGSLMLNYSPTQPLEAVNKNYVDNYVNGLTVYDSVKTATGSNLTATYDNGTNGVGATLTGTSSLGEVEGISVQLNERILVKKQTNPIENGIYVVTSLSNPWILTRASDFNSNSNVPRGSAVFVTEGNFTGTQWVMTSDSVNVGTTPIKFTQFTGPGVLVAESGILIDGNKISNSGVTKLVAGPNISLTGQTGEITIAVDGVLPISKGGTGLSTTSPGYLISNGTVLSYSPTVPVAHLSGSISVANGGTGASTPEQARTNLGAAKSGINTDIVSAIGIKEIVGPSGNYGQTDLLIKAGGGTPGQSGGSLTLESGTPGFNSSSAGQNVYIDMPVVSSSPNGGAFAIRHKLISGSVLDSNVSYAHRFGINRRGAFTIGETLSTGSAGQFLKSNGSSNAPTWSDLPSINEVLPSQTGKAGRFLQSDGTNVTWQSMNTIPVNGNNGEVLYNWNGAVTPATNMVFNNIDTLTLGTISGLNKQDLFYFKTPNGQRSGNNVLAPMGISFKPGTQVEANGAPGNVFIGGSSATGVGSQGGSVYLDGGNSTFSQGGSVIIRTTGGPGTALVNRLAIVPNGAWNINGSTGTLGQVLISSGSSASPEWRNATVDAQYIIGTTLASNVVNSSLTKVGTLTDLNVAGSVGIGTTTPKAPLSVSLGNSAEGIEFIPSATSSSIRAINRSSDTFSPIEVGGSTVTLRTISGVNLTDRLKITSTGSWELNGLAGTAGYVLTNKGPNFPPAWEAGLQTINGGTTGLTFTKNDTEITVAGTLNVSNGGTGATTAIQASQNVANFGNLRAHNAVSDFNMVREWGATYVAGNTNGPTGVPNPYDQSYQLMLSLGNNYNWNSNNIYAAQIAIPRNATNPVISIRFKESGDSSSNWGTWQKITAGAAETLSQTLPINKGGTGATTPAAAARAILTPGSTDNGKYLKWDANSNAVMWDTVIVDATKITGILPHANGGTGGGSRQAGLNSLAGVIGALANTVLRFDGTNVLLDKLNVSTDISGTLPIANGGTGASTQAAAARAILPPQSGATVNQFLMSDGTNSSWKTAVTSVNISGLQTGLTFNGGPITGTGTFELSGVLKVSNGGTGANFLTAGFVKSNGSNAFTSVAGITSDDISGTLGINKGGTGATTQAAAARAILAPQPGDSGKVLVTDGTNVSWGTANVSANSFTGTLAVDKGGTGATTASAAINALLPTQTSNNGRYLSTNGSSVSWQTISITPDNITGTLSTGKGGTGISSYSNGDLLVGNSSGTLSRLPVGSANQVLTLVNGIPAWSTPTVSAGGSTTGEIQYRSSTGALAASNTFTFNTSTNKVSFTNVPQIGSGASALDIGYLVLPRTTTFDANAKGKRVALTAGITIPANVYAAGDAFSFYNDSASPITLTQGSGLTLRKDGTTTTGNLVLAARGTALLWFNSATEAILTGSIT